MEVMNRLLGQQYMFYMKRERERLNLAAGFITVDDYCNAGIAWLLLGSVRLLSVAW